MLALAALLLLTAPCECSEARASHLRHTGKDDPDTGALESTLKGGGLGALVKALSAMRDANKGHFHPKIVYDAQGQAMYDFTDHHAKAAPSPKKAHSGAAAADKAHAAAVAVKVKKHAEPQQAEPHGAGATEASAAKAGAPQSDEAVKAADKTMRGTEKLHSKFENLLKSFGIAPPPASAVPPPAAVPAEASAVPSEGAEAAPAPSREVPPVRVAAPHVHAQHKAHGATTVSKEGGLSRVVRGLREAQRGMASAIGALGTVDGQVFQRMESLEHENAKMKTELREQAARLQGAEAWEENEEKEIKRLQKLEAARAAAQPPTQAPLSAEGQTAPEETATESGDATAEQAQAPDEAGPGADAEQDQAPVEASSKTSAGADNSSPPDAATGDENGGAASDDQADDTTPPAPASASPQAKAARPVRQ